MEEDVKIQLFQAIEDEDLEGVITCIEEGVNLDARDSVCFLVHCFDFICVKLLVVLIDFKSLTH